MGVRLPRRGSERGGVMETIKFILAIVAVLYAFRTLSGKGGGNG